MKRIHLGLLLTLSLALNAAFIGAWITRRAGDEPEPQPANATTLWDDLELDPAEETMLRTHLSELGDEAAEISTELSEDRRELFSLLQQDDPDIEAIVELQESLGKNQERMRELVILKMLEASRELDPEARRKWGARLHEYSEEQSRRKPWHRPGHRLYRRRPGGHDENLEDLLKDGVSVESVTLERGVELRFRPEDPEDVDRLHRELQDWLRQDEPRREAHEPDGPRQEHERRRSR
jgi:uncharacterized membrane protein